mmetsp:Transcript_7411/g.27120  ORF Transcript_7411/g.27120 Transcript_7411/m.27120 type:complete len:532 (+) Transcript_7411:584-2179(+)
MPIDVARADLVAEVVGQHLRVAVKVGDHALLQEGRGRASEVPVLGCEDELHDLEGPRHERPAESVPHGHQGGRRPRQRAAEADHQRLPEAREEDLLEGDEVGDLAGRGPMCSAAEQRHFGGAGVGGGHRDIDRAFAIAHDDDLLARHLLVAAEIKSVHDIAGELVLATDAIGHELVVRGIETAADDELVEGAIRMCAVRQGECDRPPTIAELLDLGDLGVEAHVLAQPEVVGIALDVGLCLLSGGEIAEIGLVHRQVGELVELFRHLDAEALVVLAPNAAHGAAHIEALHRVAFQTHGADGLQARDARAHDADRHSAAAAAAAARERALAVAEGRAELAAPQRAADDGVALLAGPRPALRDALEPHDLGVRGVLHVHREKGLRECFRLPRRLQSVELAMVECWRCICQNVRLRRQRLAAGRNEGTPVHHVAEQHRLHVAARQRGERLHLAQRRVAVLAEIDVEGRHAARLYVELGEPLQRHDVALRRVGGACGDAFARQVGDVHDARVVAHDYDGREVAVRVAHAKRDGAR